MYFRNIKALGIRPQRLFLLLPVVALGASVSTGFEGGSLGRIETLSGTHFRLGVKGESDQDGRNRQANWYYFRVDHAGKHPLTFEMVDLAGEYNYRPNRGAVTADTPPVISYDGRVWTHVESFTYDAAEPKLVLKIVPKAARFWIAHTPPYTSRELRELRSVAAKHPDFREQVIGKTVFGRDLVLWTIAHGSDSPTRPSVWLMFRQHSWESGSSWVSDGAIRELLRNDRLRSSITWKILPMCDPDGVARGGVRFNAHGFDLNRNWDVTDPKRMPEITAQRAAIQAWIEGERKIALFLTLHNTETNEYLDGPPRSVEDNGIGPLAERLYRILSGETTFAPTRPLRYDEVSTTPGMAGRMNVIQGLYHDFRIPAFLMEQRISLNPKLGHLPTIPDRTTFGAQLVQAIAKALPSE